MSVDLPALRAAVSRHGRVARIVVAETAGSVPREVGAAMLVWRDGHGIGQTGTIGGGALELTAAETAFSGEGARRYPLGPSLGQCCGGAVTLWTDWIDADWLARHEGQAVIARGPGAAPPLGVARVLDAARARGERPEPRMIDSWMVEPVDPKRQPLWIWGAGHVGRALVQTIAPLPLHAITWADTGAERFPAEMPDGVSTLWAQDLPRLAAHAPETARHLILTYSHEIDLALCHSVLTRGFAWCGLIGSRTKRMRFARRLAATGHDARAIDRIVCPIGDRALGKHPQAIALGVAVQLQSLALKEPAPWPMSCSA